MKPRPCFRKALPLVTAICLTSAIGHAASYVWDGGGANDNLATALNWDTNTVPANDGTSDLTFTGIDGVTPYSPFIATNWNVKSLTFASFAGANPFTVGGGLTITLGTGGITNNDTDTQTLNNALSIGNGVTTSVNGTAGAIVLNNPVALGSSATVINLTGNVTLNNTISGLGTLNSSGTFTLAGAGDTRTYDLVLGGGTVNLNHTGTATVNATGSISVNSGTLNINGDLVLDNNAQLTRANAVGLHIMAGKTLTVKNASDVVITGPFTHDSGTITLQGAGSILSTSNTMGIQEGATLNVTAGASFTPTGYIDVGVLGAAATLLVDAASVTLASPTTSSFWGSAAGTGNVTFRNAATGTVSDVDIAQGIYPGTTANVSIESGATLQTGTLTLAAGLGTTTAALTVTGAGSAITQTGASSLTIGAAASSVANLNVDTNGVFTTGTGNIAVNKTGHIHISTGILNANGNMVIEGILTNTSGTLSLAAGTSFTVQNGGSATFSSTRSFTNSLTVTGASSLLSTSGYLNLNTSTVSVAAGGTLSSVLGTRVGTAANTVVNVQGAGSALNCSGIGGLDIGDSTYNGTLTFSNGASGALGVIWAASGVGGSSANLNIQSGSTVTTGNINAQSGAATTTAITVTGAGSTLTQSGASVLSLGGASSSTATLTVSSNGLFTSGTGASIVLKTGTINLTGGTYQSNGNLNLNGGKLNRDATGTFAVAAGKSFNIALDGDAAFTGDQVFNTACTINVGDSGSTLTATSSLGLYGGSTTSIIAGGSVSSNYFWIGALGNGTVTVDGSGSTFNSNSSAVVSVIGDGGGSGSLTYRNNSTGTLHGLSMAFTSSAGSAATLAVQSGADVTVDSLWLAPMTSATTATATVTGSGSTLTQNGSSPMTIGATGTSSATLTTSSGGIFTSGTGVTTVEATGIINVTGGTYNANGDMVLSGRLNRDATGVFNLASGKTLTIKSSGDAVITGSYVHSGGTITLQDSGSTLNATGWMQINNGCTINVTSGSSFTTGTYLDVGHLSGGGAATLLVDAASLTTGSTLSFWGSSGSTANVTLRNGATGSVGAVNLAYGITSGTAGTVSVESGSSLQIGSLTMATSTSSTTAALTVTGAGSSVFLTGASNLTVGAAALSTATLTVANGASFTSGTGSTIIYNTGAVHINGGTYSANANLTLDGGQLTRDATGVFNLAASKYLIIQNGGDAAFAGSQGFNSSNTINVTGSGSTLTVASPSVLSLNGGNTTNVLAGGNVTSGTFEILSGNVTVDGSGSTFATSYLGANSNIGGSGGAGNLTFSNNSTGTLHMLDMASSITPGSIANLMVQSGADVTADTISMAAVTSAVTASLTVTGTGSTLTQNGATTMTLGAASASSATLTVANGGSYTSGTGNIALNPTGTLLIDGGTVTLMGHLARNGGTLTFTSGSLNIIDDFTVGTGGLLGTAPVLTNSLQFSTTGTTTIDPFKTLTVTGGRFATGSLVNNGFLDFVGGTVAITGGSGLTIGGSGALGSLVTVNTSSTLEVTNTATVQSGAFLMLDGGALNAGTLTIQAGGHVTLGDGTSRIIGSGAVSNSGVLSGAGFIATTFTNNSGGELRAEAGKTLTFTGATGANAGRVNLQGGTLEFGQAFTNSATGVVQGRGAVNFNGGLVNQGSMNFSAGTTDIGGNISMTGGTGGSARLISSGGGTVTVNNNFDHHGAEVRTSAGCNTVFFGTVTGPGPYTGTGTVYYEGTFSPGASPASVTFAGSLVCGGNLVTIMELGGTTRGTQYDSIQVADHITLAGTLSVKLINGFLPAAGNSFDLFDWGSHTGTFSTLDLPALTSGLSWDTSDLYTTGSLDVLADIPPTPGNLTATPQPGLILRLQWQNTSPPASGFEVQRALDAGFTDALHSVILPAGQTSYDDADRTPETTYHYRVRALGSPTPSAFSTPAEALTPTRLADWRWVHFGDQNPVGDGEDFNDFDHDGVVNLQEYACNMNPRVPDAKTLTSGGTSGLPAVKRASNGHLQITFLRRTSASLPTVTQGVVFSSDLRGWNPEPTAAETIDSIDALWERVTLTDPAAPAARRFARTAITPP